MMNYEERTMTERDRAICVSELLEEALDRAEMIEDQVGALFAALTYLHGVDSGQIPEENRDSAMRMAESCINKIVRQGGVNFPSYRLRREALEREAMES